MHEAQRQKLVVIVGPTASGKTSLSIKIAQKFNGEIISADSRQVYRGLDIGSGKVTQEEMSGIPHHLLDISDPQTIYTANDYAKDAVKCIANISSRTHLPIVVGGTFFYVDTLLGRISTPPVEPNLELRARLETMSAESLFAALEKVDERRAAEIDPDNKRRLIRALEVVAALGKVPEQKPQELYDALILGISITKEELHKNIHDRLLSRIDGGMIEESERLHARGLSYERMEDLGLEYRYMARHMQGHITKEEMVFELEIKIKQFAKRQMTWLKRDASIKWFKKDEFEKICEEVKRFVGS